MTKYFLMSWHDFDVIWWRVFDIMTCFDVMTNFLASWSVFTSRQTFGRIFDVMMNFYILRNLLTSWRVFDVMTNFLASCQTFRRHDVLLTSLHFVLLDAVTEFLMSWRNQSYKCTKHHTHTELVTQYSLTEGK